MSRSIQAKKEAMETAISLQASGAWDEQPAGPFWDYAHDWWICDKCPYVRESLRNGRMLTKGYVARTFCPCIRVCQFGYPYILTLVTKLQK